MTGRVIWCGVTLCWGATIGMILWYTQSKSGNTGPISAAWWWVPVGLAAALFCVAWMGRRRPARGFVIACFGLLVLGVAIATAFWYTLAQTTGGGTVSFLWISFPGLVLMLIVGYGSIPFLRPQPPSRHVGLTLWSNRTPIDETAV